MEKLEDKDGKQIDGPVDLVNQSVSHQYSDRMDDKSKDQISLDMDDKPKI